MDRFLRVEDSEDGKAAKQRQQQLHSRWQGGSELAVPAAEAATLCPDIMTLTLYPSRGISAQELAFKTPPGNPIIFLPEQGTSVSACSCSRKASTGSAVSNLMLNEEPFQVTTTGITGIVANNSLSQTVRLRFRIQADCLRLGVAAKRMGESDGAGYSGFPRRRASASPTAA